VDAFDNLVRLFEKKVYNLAYRMSGNHEDASDLSQEAFLRVFQSLKDFRGQSSFSTWLYRVVSNVCLDELRQRGRRPTVSLDEPVAGDKGEVMQRQVPDPAPPPDELAERTEIREVVQAGIEQLTEEYRMVIVLRDLQGLSYQEIAEALDCSLGTVKSRLNRARFALKEKLSALELFSPNVVYTGGRSVAKGGHGGAL
jgi:RNA polymerase sigma-70 factor (ECF subfamily)